MSAESELEELRAVRSALDGVRSAACATESADEDVRDAWNRFDAFFQHVALYGYRTKQIKSTGSLL